MNEIQDFTDIELILHVEGNGTEENVYRKREDNKELFFNSYSHIGITKKDDFWSGHDDEFNSWEQFWNEFTELEEWWFYYQPIKIHKDYKDFILRKVLDVSEAIKNKKEKGYINKWREMCIK